MSKLKTKAWEILYEIPDRINPLPDLSKLLQTYLKYIDRTILIEVDEWEETWWKNRIQQCFPLLRKYKIPIAECFGLMAEKNRLYGNRQLYLTGAKGIAIRSIDKICRIENMLNMSKEEAQSSESIRDNIIDIFNYAILAVLLIKKKL